MNFGLDLLYNGPPSKIDKEGTMFSTIAASIAAADPTGEAHYLLACLERPGQRRGNRHRPRRGTGVAS